jgi:uncharacterized protein
MDQNNDRPSPPRTGRGFAGMDPARQREISSKGGKAAHQKGTAHEFTPDEARSAGRKGGQAVSQDRNHMATIGREGGRARGGRRGSDKPTSQASETPPQTTNTAQNPTQGPPQARASGQQSGPGQGRQSGQVNVPMDRPSAPH